MEIFPCFFLCLLLYMKCVYAFLCTCHTPPYRCLSTQCTWNQLNINREFWGEMRILSSKKEKIVKYETRKVETSKIYCEKFGKSRQKQTKHFPNMSPKIVSHWILLNFMWLNQGKKEKKVPHKTNEHEEAPTQIESNNKLCGFRIGFNPIVGNKWKFEVWNLRVHAHTGIHTHPRKLCGHTCLSTYMFVRKKYTQKKVKLECMHGLFKRKRGKSDFVVGSFLGDSWKGKTETIVVKSFFVKGLHVNVRILFGIQVKLRPDVRLHAIKNDFNALYLFYLSETWNPTGFRVFFVLKR